MESKNYLLSLRWSFEHTYVPWSDIALQIAWRLIVIHRLCCLASERPHNWVIISLGWLVTFRYRTPFLHATILWGFSLAQQRTLCITCCNMSVESPYYMYARSVGVTVTHRHYILRMDWYNRASTGRLIEAHMVVGRKRRWTIKVWQIAYCLSRKGWPLNWLNVIIT